MPELDQSRQEMEAQLKGVVLPALRKSGFKGSFPHFRRIAETHIDLLTFQFDRNGGGFVIEIARCPLSGILTYWGKHIPPAKVTTWDRHPNSRKRLQPEMGSGTDSWFRFDQEPAEKIAAKIADLLQCPEIWSDVQVPTSVND